MPRTFVWHPGRGPKTDGEERADHGQGPHQAGPERHRALVADEPDARGDRPQAPPGRGDQAGFTRRCVDNSSRCATSSRWCPSRSKTVATEKIGLHNLSPMPGSNRDRKRLGRGPGSGTGKTSGKGHKGIKARAGHHGPGGGKPQLRGRSDAAHASAAEARLHQSVPRGGERHPPRPAREARGRGDARQRCARRGSCGARVR